MDRRPHLRPIFRGQELHQETLSQAQDDTENSATDL